MCLVASSLAQAPLDVQQQQQAKGSVQANVLWIAISNTRAFALLTVAVTMNCAPRCWRIRIVRIFKYPAPFLSPPLVPVFSTHRLGLPDTYFFQIGKALGMPDPGPNTEDELIQFLFRSPPTPDGVAPQRVQKVRLGVYISGAMFRRQFDHYAA